MTKFCHISQKCYRFLSANEILVRIYSLVSEKNDRSNMVLLLSILVLIAETVMILERMKSNLSLNALLEKSI